MHSSAHSFLSALPRGLWPMPSFFLTPPLLTGVLFLFRTARVASYLLFLPDEKR